MDSVRTILPWVLFVIMAVVAAFFWQQSAAHSRENEALRNVLDEMKSQVRAMSRDIDKLSEQVNEAEAVIRSLDAFDEIVGQPLAPRPAEETSVLPDPSQADAQE